MRINLTTLTYKRQIITINAIVKIVSIIRLGIFFRTGVFFVTKIINDYIAVKIIANILNLMSDIFIRKLIIGLISVIVITCGTILAISVINNPKSETPEEIADKNNNPTETETTTEPAKSTESKETTEKRNEIKTERSNLKDIARRYSGRTIPKEPLKDNNATTTTPITTPQNTADTNTTATEKINNTTPKNKPDENNQILQNIKNLPPPEITEKITTTTNSPNVKTTPEKITTENTQPKINPIEIAKNIYDLAKENIETPKIQNKNIATKPNATIIPNLKPEASTPKKLPETKTQITPQTTTPLQNIPQNIPPISIPIPPQFLPPPPPPMWVYDYSTGTIGVYYFAPINQQNTTTQQTQKNTNNQTNTTTIPNTRLLTPIPTYPITPVPIIPTPIYIAPTLQLPTQQPQPIIIFR
ncbi:MAG: hypothetical protein LBP59_04525 [Planctomycetaceae bacterium]|nr:hypothetical protein [Planctomycetaceae bacterium]